MSISAAQVKELRDQTGAGMMDCKRALAESGGDTEKAVAYLRENGLAGAAKKAGRVAAEGLVGVYEADGGARAVMVELNCETDFVAKTDKFSALLDRIGAALLSQKIPPSGTGEDIAGTKLEDGSSLADTLAESVASIGENISLRRYECLASEDGRIGSYVHAGGKIGVLVEITGADDSDTELMRSLAMQVAAAFPRYVRREEVPADEVEKEKEIFSAQALASGKPEKVIEKIVAGKIDKFFHEICLLEQDYVRDPDLTVEKLLAQASKSGSKTRTIKRFARFQLGEGIEKRQSNLAEEVAAQIAQG